MATWHVAYVPAPEPDLGDPTEAEGEGACFCIFPDGEPERWIAKTNPALPPDVQEEAALLMAAALTKAV